MYIPRRVGSIVPLIWERVGRLLVKPVSDDRHGRIFRWESSDLKPISGTR